MLKVLWYFLGFAAFSGIVIMFIVVPSIVTTKVFVRVSKKKWHYNVQEPNDAEQVQLYSEATAWAERYESHRRSVGVQSDGFNLYGEYYDFGFDKAVLIIAGRTEACRYSCYFADGYRRAGYNVLTIDNRSHGNSDGVVNTLGIREYRDILCWIRLLHDDLQNKSVVCHGICIGSATALYALVNPQCPEYVRGMVADGMYVHFGESFRNHLIERNKPIFPCYQVCMALVGLVAGRNPRKFGPQNVIHQLKKPILFLHGREDIYSVPEKAEYLYGRCSAPKKLVWFDKGRHSFLRYHAKEKYDQTIVDFLGEMDA